MRVFCPGVDRMPEREGSFSYELCQGTEEVDIAAANGRHTIVPAGIQAVVLCAPAVYEYGDD